MDTRFWGPSGWKLLHCITFNYKYSPTNAVVYAQFLESIPYILPCKFCRASLTEYYKKYPLTTYVNISVDLKKWMYKIHNCVNDKLREQGLNPNSNPKYSEVKKMYEEWTDWEGQLSTFWDFLFAVAYNHPKESKNEPMPDCPKDVLRCKDKIEKNKWNVLGKRDRLYWYTRFWSNLPAVLPEEISKKWKKIENPPTIQCRRSTLAWLWRMRCSLDSKFKDPYTSICKKITSYSSDCNNKSITCRKTRKNPRKKKLS